MPTFSHPSMPLYVHDQASYKRQMHDWHNHMARYHEEKRMHHLEMAKHFHKMMGGRMKDPETFIKEEVKTA
jgi:hypothetical protein